MKRNFCFTFKRHIVKENTEGVRACCCDKHALCKAVIFFILSCVVVSTVVLSFVCLQRADGIHDKHHGPNSFSSPQLRLLLISPQSSQSSIILTSSGKDAEDLVGEEEEKEDEIESSTGEKVTHVLFLWHFTAAAVCFSIFIVVAVVLLLIYNKVYEEDEDRNKCLRYFYWVPLLAIPLAVVPAVRMDLFSTASYWLFFIPYLLLALALPMLYFYWVFTDWVQRESVSFRCYVIATAPVSYVLFVAGLVLCILRLDKILPPSFQYAFVFIFPAVGFIFASFPAFDYLMYDPDEVDAEFSEYQCVPCAIVVSIVVTMVLYGGFVLPFTLRKEHVFDTSYHFALIPYYILIVIVLLYLICTNDFGRFSKIKLVLFIILSVIAVVFLALSFVCLGGANDAYEEFSL